MENHPFLSEKGTHPKVGAIAPSKMFREYAPPQGLPVFSSHFPLTISGPCCTTGGERHCESSHPGQITCYYDLSHCAKPGTRHLNHWVTISFSVDRNCSPQSKAWKPSLRYKVLQPSNLTNKSCSVFFYYHTNQENITMLSLGMNR